MQKGKVWLTLIASVALVVPLALAGPAQAAAPSTDVASVTASTNTAITSGVASSGGSAKHLVMAGNGWAVYGEGVSRGPTQVVSASATAEQALATVSTLGVGNWCGWSHCSVIIYRGTTKSIANAVARYQNSSLAAIAGAFAIACAPIGGVGAVVCAAVGAVVGSYAIDQFIYARDHNMCISIDYLVTGNPYNVRPLNDSNCHN